VIPLRHVVRLTVPGNLLLLGEYAVTEQGGLGLAVAVERRVVAELEPADSLVIEGRWAGRTVRESPLFSAVVDTWRAQLAERGLCPPPERTGGARVPGARILVDSSAFFTGSRKGGFGSSAAVTVALTCAMLHLSGFSGPGLLQCAAGIALSAHRRAQSGRGSGYDVYASLYGGFGCLSGGADPLWQAVELPWLPPMYLFQGPASVSTTSSLQRYERWKAGHPGEWKRFLEESNRGVRRFLAAESWSQARSIFASARELGLRLGERIGVSARVDAPVTLDQESCKALGAGNELGICLGAESARGADLEYVAVAAEGVRWQL
jgi:phosphomevalonate kinase